MAPMAIDIPRAQQKIFIENFMDQVLTVALDLVERGKDKGGPGQTIDAVARAVIREIKNFGPDGDGTSGGTFDA